MSIRGHNSWPRPRHTLNFAQTPLNDSSSSASNPEALHCCGCSSRGRRRVLSPSTHASLYREHAAHYAHKFRAAIDYTIQEKPRQIVSGGLLLLFLFFISFLGPRSSPPATTVIPPSQQGGFQSDVRVCCMHAVRPFINSYSECEVERSGGIISDEQKPSAKGKDGELHDEETSFPDEQQSSLRLSDKGGEKRGEHVTAPGVSWEGLFPTSTEPVSPGSESVRRAMFALFVLIAVYCFLQSKDGLLVRPHPGFWRVVHGVCLAHLLLLVWLLAVTPEIGRETLQHLFPEIRGKRKDVFAGTLVADCRINMNTFYRQITSVWFVSHVIGWLAKMIILRDWGFCLLYSISFEVAEISFHWLVPELRECWWDSVVVDALLSNLSGMVLGVVLMKLVKMHRYDWMGRHPLYRKIVTRFTPFGGGYEWAFYKTPRHLGLAIILLLLCVFTELNVFFLMAVLDIPAAHYCNPLRVLYLTLLGASAAAEHYEYTMHSQERIGHNEWLLAIILLVELLVCAKYGSDRFKSATVPAEIYICWGLSLALFGIWCSCYYTVKRDSAGANEKCDPRLIQQAETECLNDVAFMRAGRHIVKQETRDISPGLVPPAGRLTEGKADAFKKSPGSSSWEVTGQQLRWYGDRLRLLVLTIPPQACFLPLTYLSKFYYYDYHEVK